MSTELTDSFDPLELAADKKEQETVWVEWSPRQAPHVKGRYSKREFDPSTKMPKPQTVEARCERCGKAFRGLCMSGAVRGHIQRFAAHHHHTDPLDAPRVERPGSRRVKSG